MQLRRIPIFLACSSGLALVVTASLGACGGGDSAPANPVDSGKVDTGGDSKPKPGDPDVSLGLTILSKDRVDVPADLSCVGKPSSDAGPEVGPGDSGGDADPDAPVAPGTPIDVQFRLVEFGGGSSDIVVGAKVDFFKKNTLIPDVPDFSSTTDPKGLITVNLPAGGLFAYRVLPNTNLRTFVYFGADAPLVPGKQYEGTAITKSKYDQFALAITGKTGFLTAPGKGIFSARVHDCAGREVRNAIVQLLDATTGNPLPTGPADDEMKPLHYLTDGDLPSNGYTATARTGLIAVINVPKTTDTVKIKAVASGIYGDSKEIRKFAEANLEITAEAVNFRYLDPH